MQQVETLAFDWTSPKESMFSKPTKHKQQLANNQRALKKLSKFANKDHTITKLGINLSSTIAGWQLTRLSNHILVLLLILINFYNELNRKSN